MGWFDKKKESDAAVADGDDMSGKVTAIAGQKSDASGSSLAGNNNPDGTKSAQQGSGQPMGGNSSGIGFIAPELTPLEKRFGRLRSALGPGTEVQGRLSFDSAVSLDGVLKGTIRSTELIVVSRQGRVEATSLLAKGLVIAGEVTGEDVTVSERFEILADGKFIGNVTTPMIAIAEGGIFEGVCNISSAKEAASLVIPPLSAPANGNSTRLPLAKIVSGSAGPATSASATSGSNISAEDKSPKKKISMDQLLGK